MEIEELTNGDISLIVDGELPPSDEIRDEQVKITSHDEPDQFNHHFLAELRDLCQGSSGTHYLDVEVICRNGRVSVASPLLATISPLFRTAASAPLKALITGTEPEPAFGFSLHLPDIEVDDFKTFWELAWEYGSDLEKSTAQNVFGVLCMDCQAGQDISNVFLIDQDWNQIAEEQEEEGKVETVKPKISRKPRKRTKIESQPYVRTEVMETHRTSDKYALRATIKRKRFTDEVSEASGVSDDDNDISSEGESDYEPSKVEEEAVTKQDEADDDQVELEDDDETLDVNIEEDEDTTIVTEVVESADIIPEIKAPKDQLEGLSWRSVRLEDGSMGRMVSVMEGEAMEMSMPEEPLLQLTPNPRSLLKQVIPNNTPILMCSACSERFSSVCELKRHAAKNHEGSKFFILSPKNPHSTCIECSIMMRSYEKLFASDDELQVKDICFPCPHCHRRFIGNFDGLMTHLQIDHRNAVSEISDATLDLSGLISVMRNDDPKSITCEFCAEPQASASAFNKHLFTCTKNFCSHSPGLFCHICGKMFVEHQFLKDHLHRHGAEKLQKVRDFFCTFCPVACTSEAHLQRHVDREHSNTELDVNFILHENCLSCEALFCSYVQNKATLAIPTEELAFKCPHCCTILFAHQKHAPRYLRNHVNKFHWDESVNDFTLKGHSSEDYKVLSRLDPDLFTCDFCSAKSDSREDHNEHLALCPANTSTSKPGYMCDTCGLIAGTARLLKNHLNTSHNKPKEEKVLKVIGRKPKTKLPLNEDWLEDSPPGKVAQGKRKRGRPPKNKNSQTKREDPSGMKTTKKPSNPLRVECKDCPMDFKREEDMLAHSVIHKGKIMCPIHNIMFKLESEVFQHVNQADPKDKSAKLVCCMCGDTFKHMCIYMKHLRRHLNISPYDCPLCGKGFRVFDTLQSHLARVHGQGNEDKSTRWFHCDQCSKSFLTRGHLREHILGMHDKSEMFYCPACGKTFQTKKRVQRHIYVAHKDIKEQYTTHRKLEVFGTN